MPTLDELLGILPQRGHASWIGVRPARRAALLALDAVEVRLGEGLSGDRFAGQSSSTRQVTLIQHEHLIAVASLLGVPRVDPALTRRNLVVRGINLLALVGARFRIGEVVLEGTGRCHPCSRMEENLGPGGYNAMRGHGGITARVIEPGMIRLGDIVSLVEPGKLGRAERD